MRQLLTGLATTGLLVVSATAAAGQQGSIQLSGAAQGVTGDRQRTAGQTPFEPDFGISWLQPRARWGVFQLEARGARRRDRLHAGRLFFGLREAKYRGLTWELEAGDSYFLPTIGGYKFSNLFTPAVTFTGGSVTARNARNQISFVAGRASAWRNLFGSDPQALGQTIGTLRGTHRRNDRLELSARVSRVRTSSLGEFSFGISASDQAGGGARLWLTPSIQLVADASAVSFRRRGSDVQERDGSALVGANWLHKRGWVQVNASRFSPGELPTLNSSLSDRQSVFAAGEHDLYSRLRVFGGLEWAKTNVKPETSIFSSQPLPRTANNRGFGGVRVQLTARSALTLRAEQGGRNSRPVLQGFATESDGGFWSAELQAAAGRFTTFGRYSVRRNVERLGLTGSYRQHDASGQIFANLSRGTQLFASALASRTELGALGGSTYWQAGGGGQIRVARSELWVRVEGAVARNVDLLTQNFVPRESLNIGLSGQITPQMTLGFNVNVDRSPMPFSTGSPWLTRSILRVSHSMSTGSAYVPTTVGGTEAAAGRGTGSVTGTVFVDWNGNGVRDAEDTPVEGIPMRIGAGATTTGRDGQFAFLNVPTGTREVGLDTAALPLDFDAPAIPQVQIQLSRGDNPRVSFGLLPLGLVQGRVLRDTNGNATADPADEPMSGAIIVMDGGARSEQVRGGRFRFDGVRSGDHTVKLLLESLPTGAIITGDAELKTSLTKEHMSADVVFLVSIEVRPEIRKVFPPKGGGGGAAPQGARTPAAPSAASGGNPRSVAPRDTRPRTTRGRPVVQAAQGGRFAIQIAALSASEPATVLERQLKAAGLPAYVVAPDNEEAPYRVRVGPFSTRAAASKVAASLEKKRGEKLWVLNEKR